jgi:hypothetical protein
LTVWVTDMSMGMDYAQPETAWSYDFRDGSVITYLRSTFHRYTKPGEFYIVHSASVPNYLVAYGDQVTVTDTTPPSNCAVIINGGAAYTKTAAVTQTLTATDAGSGMSAGKVLLSNDGVTYTESAFAATKSWTLAGSDGNKMVYAKFKDAIGNITAAPATGAIILDHLPPEGGSLAAFPPTTGCA